MKYRTFLTTLLSLGLVIHAGLSQAQGASNVSGVLEEIKQDDGYIVIDGQRLAFRASEVDISYRGDPVRSSFLTEGLNVRYSSDNTGKVLEIVLIGPENVLDGFDEQ